MKRKTVFLIQEKGLDLKIVLVLNFFFFFFTNADKHLSKFENHYKFIISLKIYSPLQVADGYCCLPAQKSVSVESVPEQDPMSHQLLQVAQAYQYEYSSRACAGNSGQLV